MPSELNLLRILSFSHSFTPSNKILFFVVLLLSHILVPLLPSVLVFLFNLDIEMPLHTYGKAVNITVSYISGAEYRDIEV
jgi:hypothetical protein